MVKKKDLERKYREKLVDADEAVRVVKSGDSVHYGIFCGVVKKLDQALAKRANELENVKVYLTFWPYKDIPEIIKADPSGQHFDFMTFHMSGVERRMNENKLCYYVPMQYREVPKVYTESIGNIDVAMLQVSPMDKFGNFNIGPQVAESWGILESAKKIIVEVNPNQPVVAGTRNTIHIDDVDFVVEGDANPLPTVASKEPTEEEKQIAKHVIKHIESGSTLQLGIGSLPNYVGTLISESEIEDLSVHSEMFVDAFYRLYQAGKITGNKNLDRGKMVYSFAFGSQELYEFLDENPLTYAAPIDYVNSIAIIARIDKMVSINSFLQVDLFGQVNSESIGVKHISGTGGQLDFVLGAFLSKGGKSFLCSPSTRITKDGQRQSTILPVHMQGSIVTVPRSAVHYIATEYGIVNLKGKSIKERAKLLISIAHPDFREELEREAIKMKLI
ncbi:MAG: butyryl-CoA:acetate CoA-transferase [Clostridiales bacterium]|nr:butyryl-CoA:acetate CoA-transferase [Clostridiales bacterium]